MKLGDIVEEITLDMAAESHERSKENILLYIKNSFVLILFIYLYKLFFDLTYINLSM